MREATLAEYRKFIKGRLGLEKQLARMCECEEVCDETIVVFDPITYAARIRDTAKPKEAPAEAPSKSILPKVSDLFTGMDKE